MKYDSWDDYFYFIIGLSVSSGRNFWVGGTENSNISFNENSVTVNINNNEDDNNG